MPQEAFQVLYHFLPDGQYFFKIILRHKLEQEQWHLKNSLVSLLLPLYTERIKKEMRGGKEKSFILFSSSWLTQPCCNMAGTTRDSLSSFPRLVG